MRRICIFLLMALLFCGCASQDESAAPILSCELTEGAAPDGLSVSVVPEFPDTKGPDRVVYALTEGTVHGSEEPAQEVPADVLEAIQELGRESEPPTLFAIDSSDYADYAFARRDKNSVCVAEILSGETNYLELTADEVAGKFADMHRVGTRITEPGCVAAYGGIVYFTDIHYGEGDGIPRTYISAFDMDGNMLGQYEFGEGEELISMQTDADGLTVLFLADDGQLRIYLFSPGELTVIEQENYEQPQQWLELVGENLDKYSYGVALITDEKLYILTPQYYPESGGSVVYLASYWRGGELESLLKLTLDRDDYRFSAVFTKAETENIG